MKQRAFRMKLKPGFEAEYERRHNEIWPELAALLTQAGISDYSIFLDRETLTLFAVQKLSDDNATASLREHPLMRKWSDSMADIMDAHPDHSPVEVNLKQMFHLS